MKKILPILILVMPFVTAFTWRALYEILTPVFMDDEAKSVTAGMLAGTASMVFVSVFLATPTGPYHKRDN